MEEIGNKIGNISPRMPKGILKIKRIDPSEASEEDEATPFNCLKNYKLTSKVSSVFSSEKEISEIDKQYTFGSNLEYIPETVTQKRTSKFGY